MKEFSKSIASAGLAGALFGARQLANVITQPPRNGESDKATEAFNSIAQAAADQCGDSLRETFHAVDRMQRAVIDTGFRFVSLDAFNSYGATESFSGSRRNATRSTVFFNASASCICWVCCSTSRSARQSDSTATWR